jgi:chitin-binding protein
MEGRLPAGRTGRHLIYTIWQNSDTPDTYYSCSDVLFGDTANPAPDSEPTAAVGEPTADTDTTVADAPTGDSDTAAGADAEPAAADTPAVRDGDLVWVIGAAALLAAATAGAVVLLLRRR